MAPRVHTHRDILKVLHKAKPGLRQAILKEADKSVVYSICEICQNTLLGNLALTDSQKSRVKKHKDILRRLAQRGENWQTKKKLLVQHGGAFLPILLGVLSSALGSLFSS